MDFTERSTRIYRTKQLYTKEELEARESLCVHEQPAFCTAACPMKLDAREFARLCAEGDFTAARAMLERITPFPLILASGCPAPCAAKCRLGELEGGEGLDLPALERAALRLGSPRTGRGLLRFKKKKTAAVIGAELFTLATAAELARKSYPTVFYVREPDAAALVAACAPFLCPEDLAAETERLLAMDLDVRYGSALTPALLERERERDILCVSREYLRLLSPDEEPDTVTLLCPALGVLARGDGEQGALGALFDARRAGVSADRLAQGMDPATMRGDEGSVESRLYTDLSAVSPSRRIPEPPGGYSAGEARAEAARCIQCECVECLKGCAYLRHYDKFPRILTREIYNNAGIIMGDHMMNKALNSCALCGQCTVTCPNGYDMAEICLSARENMVATGKMSLAVHEFALYDQIFSNGEAFLCRRQPGYERCRYVFFPGCQAGAVAPEVVERAYADLCARLEGGVALILGCCGAVSRWAGRTELTEETDGQLRSALESLGSPEVIAGCPTCAVTLRALSAAPVRGVWDTLLDIGLPATASHAGGTAALHDSCGARGDASTQSAVRELLGRLGFDIKEGEWSCDRAPCCGYGGLVSYANPRVASELARSCVEDPSLPQVTYCMACRDRLAREGAQSVHLLELVYGVQAAQTPGISEKRRNRLLLKQTLLRDIWGEDVQKKDLGFRLDITDEARALMEERMILDTDVQQVMQRYRASGEAVLENESGLLVTRARLGNVTFWAKFTEEPDGYTIRRVYSHRMTIETR